MTYFTDIIILSNLSVEDKYGEKAVIGLPREVECRVEADNRLITNSQGEDIRTHTFMMMDREEVVKVGDTFTIVSKNGLPYRETEKIFQIKVIEDNMGFGIGNLEVFC